MYSPSKHISLKNLLAIRENGYQSIDITNPMKFFPEEVDSLIWKKENRKWKEREKRIKKQNIYDELEEPHGLIVDDELESLQIEREIMQ